MMKLERHRAARTALGWLMLLFILSGCGSLERSNRTDRLDQVMRAYSKAMRWGEFELAANVAGITASRAELEGLKKVKITSYSEQPGEMSPAGNEARQVVRIEFHLENAMRIHTIDDIQLWRYDEARQLWLLASGFPDFFGASR